MAPIDDKDPRAEAVRLIAAALREHYGDRALDLARRIAAQRGNDTWALIVAELEG